MSLIEYRDLCIGYEHKIIIRNINLQIESGDYVCVFGDNGIGKTTFLKTTLGLLPPVRGHVIRHPNLNRKMIGYLPQHTKVKTDFPASSFEVVLSGCLNRLHGRPFYRKAEKELARENMKLLGVSNLAYRPFRELSGGQQQRVLLARALCATDKILVLDEPFTGLDQSTSKSLYEILDKINHELGVTIIIVSHYMADVISHANKVIHLSKENVFSGTIEEYRERFDHSFIKNIPPKEKEEVRNEN